MLWRFLLVAAFGGICYLDRTAAFQVMLHRPLFVASLVGAIFGDLAAGAQVGAVLELLYIVRLPVGASIPPDDTGAAVFGGAAAATASSSIGLDPGNFTAILLLSVLCAESGKVADRFVRRMNGRIVHLTVDRLEKGDPLAVEHGLMAGITLFGVFGMSLALLFSGLGVSMARFLLTRFGPESHIQFAAMLPAVPLLGAASVFSCSRTDRTSPVFYLTMGCVFAAIFFFRWLV
jgi:PTS system mannose-specific IIC component